MSTFGSTTSGGSTSALATQAYYVQYQMGAVSGSSTSMSWYIASSAGSNLKFALYSDNAGAPGTVIASVTGSVGAATGWVTLNWATAVDVTANAYYWLAARAETATTSAYYRTGTFPGGRVTVTYASFPADNPTFETSYTTRSYAAYVTYTEAAGNPHYAYMQQ
jgi:hypothetical protein